MQTTNFWSKKDYAWCWITQKIGDRIIKERNSAVAPTCRVSVFSRQIKRENERREKKSFTRKETFDTRLVTTIYPSHVPSNSKKLHKKVIQFKWAKRFSSSLFLTKCSSSFTIVSRLFKDLKFKIALRITMRFWV